MSNLSDHVFSIIAGAAGVAGGVAAAGGVVVGAAGGGVGGVAASAAGVVVVAAGVAAGAAAGVAASAAGVNFKPKSALVGGALTAATLLIFLPDGNDNEALVMDAQTSATGVEASTKTLTFEAEDCEVVRKESGISYLCSNPAP